MSISQMIINFLIVSIPEEFFISMLILILLGRYDFLEKEFWKENMMQVFLKTVLPIAILSNFLKYIDLDDNLALIINTFACTIVTSILLKLKTMKEYLKVLLFTSLGSVLFMITELITIVISVYVLKIMPDYFNTNPFFNFTLLLPERAIQYGALSLIFLKRNGLSQVNISKLIWNNHYLRTITIFFTTVDTLILGLMLKFIIYEDILKALPIYNKLLVITIGLMLIIFNLLSTWLSATCVYPSEKYIQKKLGGIEL